MNAGDEPGALPDEVRWRIEKCEGYLDLKMHQRARLELREVPPAYRAALPIQQCELRLALDQGEWARAAEVARALVARVPAEPAFRIQLAFAVRRAEGIEPARAILAEAREQFPDEVIIPFNLSCYACQLGRLDEARKHLASAIAMNPGCREMAMEDDDLKPLWPELG